MKKSRISLKIHAKMDAKSDPKIDIWVLRDQICLILRGFLMSATFYEFSFGKKLSKITQLGLEGWQQARRGVSEGAVGG